MSAGKYLVLGLLVGVVSLALSNVGAAAEEETTQTEIINTTCPVMGGAVTSDTTNKTVYQGKTIGFCCAGCVVQFQKDPDKYMEIIEEEEIINTTCPVMTAPVDKTTPYKIVYKGKKVGFCCAGCVGAFKKDPDKYMQKIKEEKGTAANQG